jgi:hypothetical protein
MIPMSELRDQLPVPRQVLNHYSGMAGFVNSTPELMWRRSGCIALKPQFLCGLRRAAAAAAAAAEEEAAAAAAVGKGRKRSRKQQQQEAEEEEGTGAGEYRPKKRHATAASAKAQAAREREKQQAAEQVAAAAREWLQQLAMRLIPQNNPANAQKVAIKNLPKKGLAVPECVLEHYGTIFKFIKATPGLRLHSAGDSISTSISLSRGLHQALRAEAAEAAADGA